MGLLEKLGNAMEKSAAKNMTGDSKEAYLNEQTKKEETVANVEIKDNISGSYSAEELKNLDSLLKKIGAVDSEGLWIAGFSNFKSGQNAVFANILTGKKNLKFLARNKDTFYLIKLDKGNISSYKTFSNKDVYQVEIQNKLLFKSLKLKLSDSTVFTIDVTENKDKVKLLKNILK